MPKKETTTDGNQGYANQDTCSKSKNERGENARMTVSWASEVCGSLLEGDETPYPVFHEA